MESTQITDEGLLAGLNLAQRAAVLHGEGPLLIVAGAGTGKTKTLATRVAHLISRGIAPEKILLLTFTRRAADEMLRRAERLIEGTVSGGARRESRTSVGDAETSGHGDAAQPPSNSPLSKGGGLSPGKVWGGTFHSTANRLLRMYGWAVGLSPDFTVMDESDSADLINLIRNELGFSKTDRRFPRKETLVKIYSHTVNAQRPLREVLETHYPWCAEDRDGIRQIFEAFVQRKKEQQVLDYDDLLLFWSALCSSSVGAKVADRFEHILVDEYQDTNAIQAEVLRGMRQKYPNITVVGDDAQSIYSFRAATIRNIFDFPQQFPGTTVVTLEQNYRSTQPILAASNAVMEGAKERYTKELWSERKSQIKPALVTCLDETEQTESTCRHILEHLEQGIPLMRQAVLFRAGHHSAMLEVELSRRNIPYHKYGGLKFMEAAHIKDMLAILRILENPHDEISWFRVLLWIEGVGPRTARRIMDELGVRRVTSSNDSAEREPKAPEAVRITVQAGDAGPAAQAAGSGRLSALALVASDSGDAAGRPVGPKPDEEPGEIISSDFHTPLTRFVHQPPHAPGPAREQLAALREALAYCRGLVSRNGPAGEAFAGKDSRKGECEQEFSHQRHPEPSLVAQIERIRQFYEPVCQRLYDNAAPRLRDIDQLLQIASRYASRRGPVAEDSAGASQGGGRGASARSRFITDLTLDPPQSTSDLAQPPYLEEDYLILSTIHSAKGCEWDVVHILHAADGMIPSDMAMGDEAGVDEERRLFYVAMTRAKDMLYVYFPLRYYHTRFGMGDPHHFAQLTRFLPPPIRSFFEQRATMIEVAEDKQHVCLTAAKEPYARVNRLWGD